MGKAVREYHGGPSTPRLAFEGPLQLPSSVGSTDWGPQLRAAGTLRETEAAMGVRGQNGSLMSQKRWFEARTL